MVKNYPDIDHIDPLSVSTVQLECFCSGNSIGHATGFVVSVGQGDYVITNQHVVTGKNSDTGKLLNETTGAVPDSIKIRHHSSHRFGEWIETVEKLYDEEGNERWIEHPAGRNVDVVAIP